MNNHIIIAAAAFVVAAPSVANAVAVSEAAAAVSRFKINGHLGAKKKMSLFGFYA